MPSSGGLATVKISFCTCPDLECPRHPSNHEGGCAPCVANCLQENEIPSCFFRKIDPEMSRKQDYTFGGFARFVRDHEEA